MRCSFFLAFARRGRQRSSIFANAFHWTDPRNLNPIAVRVRVFLRVAFQAKQAPKPSAIILHPNQRTDVRRRFFAQWLTRTTTFNAFCGHSATRPRNWSQDGAFSGPCLRLPLFAQRGRLYVATDSCACRARVDLPLLSFRVFFFLGLTDVAGELFERFYIAASGDRDSGTSLRRTIP